MLNATFNSISVLSWRSVLLVVETGGPSENHRPVASHWVTLSHNVVSSTPRHECGSNSPPWCGIGTDYTGSCNFQLPYDQGSESIISRKTWRLLVCSIFFRVCVSIFEVIGRHVMNRYIKKTKILCIRVFRENSFKHTYDFLFFPVSILWRGALYLQFARSKQLKLTSLFSPGSSKVQKKWYVYSDPYNDNLPKSISNVLHGSFLIQVCK